jgi:hypothetical protein
MSVVNSNIRELRVLVVSKFSHCTWVNKTSRVMKPVTVNLNCAVTAVQTQHSATWQNYREIKFRSITLQFKAQGLSLSGE